MLYTIAVVLLILWAVGLVSSYTILLVNFISGRRAV